MLLNVLLHFTKCMNSCFKAFIINMFFVCINTIIGTFVCVLTSTLRKRIEENSPSDKLWPSCKEIKSLLVKSKKGKEIFFYDEGKCHLSVCFQIFLLLLFFIWTYFIFHYNKWRLQCFLHCKKSFSESICLIDSDLIQEWSTRVVL